MSVVGIRAYGSAVETAALVGRSVRYSVGSIDALLVAVLSPVVILLMFVYVFGGAIETGTAYVVPWIILVCAAFGSATTSVAVNRDMTTGVIDRFRSLPILGSAVLTGHVVASVLRNAVSSALVFGVALLVGFRPSAGPLDWLAVGGMLLLVMVALSWLAAAYGLLVGSAEAAGSFSFVVMFLPYLSSAFVPVETMPRALRAIAAHQPFTPFIETVRGLLLGTPIGDGAVIALAWCAGFTAVGVAGAHVLFRRRTAC